MAGQQGKPPDRNSPKRSQVVRQKPYSRASEKLKVGLSRRIQIMADCVLRHDHTSLYQVKMCNFYTNGAAAVTQEWVRLPPKPRRSP